MYSPALTDFTFMVSGISKMFITGPQVIKAVTGEDVTPEDLGGAKPHNQKSGVAHFIYDSETECIENIKKLLSFLPSNNLDDPPFIDAMDDPHKIIPELNEMVPVDPNKPYDIKDIIKSVVDHNDFFEVQPLFAQNIVIGFGRLNGHSVGIIAN